MTSERNSKHPRTNSESTVRERLLRRAGVPLIAAFTAVALSACANTGANEQPQPEPTSISSEAPSATPTETPTNEFESVPSGLKVDYEAFADWDNIMSFTNPSQNSLEEDRNDYTYPNSKRSICQSFFESNGLEINVDMGTGWELDSNGEDLSMNGEEFVSSMIGRQNMMLALAADGTDPRNLEVAYSLLECVTAPNSDSRQELTSVIEGIRAGDIHYKPMTLQSVDKFVHEQNGNAFAKYTLVSPDGDTEQMMQLWTGVHSGSSLYRSENYSPVTE